MKSEIINLKSLVLALGLGLTLWASYTAHTREKQRLATQFQNDAATLTAALNREISLTFSVLSSLGALHTLSEAITPTDFAEFATKGLLHQKSILGSFGFAQRIPLDVKRALDAETPNSLVILEPGTNGLQPATDRPIYYPITYQTPDNQLGLPTGLDLATLPGQIPAITRMALTGQPTLGAAIPSLTPGQQPDILITAPFGAGDTFTGFTLARLQPQLLLSRAAQQVRLQQMQVTFYDPALGAPARAATATLALETPISLADQTWTLRYEAAPDYHRQHAAATAWLLILIGGSAATILLATLVALQTGRARAIEETVHLRTAELQDANRQLAEEMDERVRLEDAIHTATLREKQRIGADLHDSLGQKLTGAVYLARALESDLPPAAREQTAKLIDLLKDAITQVRRTARGLAPLEVGEDGLTPALRRLAEETCTLYNIACSFKEGGAPQYLASDEMVHLYHIAQEAISNATRHGHATEIEIALTPEQLTITDNGRGFDLSQTTPGAGLRIMRHRSTRLGAKFALHSNPQKTQIKITLPSANYPPES